MQKLCAGMIRDLARNWCNYIFDLFPAAGANDREHEEFRVRKRCRQYGMHSDERVGTKHQVVIPKAVFNKLGLAPGDYVEVALRKNQTVITRKKFVDDFPTTDEALGSKTRASIRQGLKEIKAGKGHGPFKNAKNLISDLHRKARGTKSLAFSMELIYSPAFLEAYGKLATELREQVDKQPALLAGNPHHPSLRTHKRRGEGNVWQARITQKYRLFSRWTQTPST